MSLFLLKTIALLFIFLYNYNNDHRLPVRMIKTEDRGRDTMKIKRLISILLCVLMLAGLFAVEASANGNMPKKYDLRNDGLVTPVKLQNPWGACWAFGGIAAAETSLLSTYGSTYEESGLDLSERHLTYFAMQPVSEAQDPQQAGEGLHLFNDDVNAAFDAGGLSIFITTLFSQGVGPLPEIAFPYRGKNNMTELEYFNEHADEETMHQIELVAASQNLTA